MNAETKEAAHTPGPWGLAAPPYHVDVFGADGFKVAETKGFGSIHRDFYAGLMGDGHWGTTPGAHIERADEEQEANARLIAAAPDMLAALKNALALLDEGPQHLSGHMQNGDHVWKGSTHVRLEAMRAAIAKASPVQP